MPASLRLPLTVESDSPLTERDYEQLIAPEADAGHPSRRRFVKALASIAAIMALPGRAARKLAENLLRNAVRLPVIWLDFYDCTGDTESFIRAAQRQDPLHPSVGETTPNYTGPTPPYDYLNTSSKYSWLKAPRYDGKVVEVGPLARVAVAYAAGHPRIRALVNGLFTYSDRPAHGMFSTLGRIMARAVETQALAEQLPLWIDQLRNNINAGMTSAIDNSKWYPSTWGTNLSGWGATEAPRGALAHWVKFNGGSTGKITAYQCVVPTTWNASPRDKSNMPGPLEQALVGTPVVDAEAPVEILRTVHSFDPCMACAVHVIDPQTSDSFEVTTQHAAAVG